MDIDIKQERNYFMIANFKDKMGGGSKPVVSEELNVIENGTYTPNSGVDCFNPVNVDVPNVSKGFDYSQLSKSFAVNTSISTFDKTGLDISNCTAFNFTNTNIKSLDIGGLDTKNLTTFSLKNQYNNLELRDLDISGLDLSNVTNLYLYRLVFLVNIKSDGLKLPDVNMKENVDFGDNSPLTVESLVGLLNALPTTTNGYSFRIGRSNLHKLSEEQKNIAVNKGWTLI